MVEANKEDFGTDWFVEKKEFFDWYEVSTIMGKLILDVIILRNFWGFVLNPETIIAFRCAVALSMGLSGLSLLFFLLVLVDFMVRFLKNRRSGFTVFLTREVERGRINRRHYIFLLPIMSVFCLCVTFGLYLLLLSPKYYKLPHQSKAILFSECFSMSSLALHSLFYAATLFVAQIIHRMSTPPSEITLRMLEKLYRVLRKVYFVLNLVFFWGLYTKAEELHFQMKFGIFAAYFYSFLALLVILLFTEPKHDGGKLLESPAWMKLVELPEWKKTPSSNKADEIV